MIKHEEIRELAKRLLAYTYLLNDYITEQKKKDNLLKLYRDYFYALPDEAILLREDILYLEEEMK